MNLKLISLTIAVIIGASIIGGIVIMSIPRGADKSSNQDLPSYFGGPEVPSQFISAEIINDAGFVDKKVLLSDARPPVHDFILRPGTTGHITIQYAFTQVAANNSDFQIKDSVNNYIDNFNSNKRILRLTSGSIVDASYDKTGIRMSVSPSEIKYSDNGIVQLTYTIDADVSVEPGTYILETYSSPSHFGQFITIGSEHYNGRMPWD